MTSRADAGRTWTSATWQAIALGAYLGLIVLTLAWEGWLAPSPHFPRALVLMVKALPLLAPLFGLLHGKLFTFGWASLLILAYFAEAVTVAITHRHEPWSWASVLPYALAELILTILFFIAALNFIRARRREQAR